MAQVVEDGDDAGQNVKNPAYYEDPIESPSCGFMGKSIKVLDRDGVLFLQEEKSPNR